MTMTTSMDTITTDDTHSDPLAMLRLWQLISPALPVGAYAYSGGMESAIEAGWVRDESTAQDWIQGVVSAGLVHLDVPVLVRLYRAWCDNDLDTVWYWNSYIQASRESSELLAEDRHLGQALARLLSDLDVEGAEPCRKTGSVSFATLFALATVRWNIALRDAVQGYLWAWCENQVAAAIKLIPLGQTAGQRILGHLMQTLPEHVQQGLVIQDQEIGMSAPALAIASAWHEHQYSRLFRS